MGKLGGILDSLVNDFVTSAYSDGHWDNLVTYSAKYQEFCELLNLIPFPLEENQLCRYIAYLTLSLRSPKSIRNYVSGVKKLHAFARIKLPEYSEFVNILLDGVTRVLDHVAVQAPPITPEMLKKISALVDLTDTKQVVIFTAMLTAFYLFLRSSNYVAKTTLTFNGGKQLMRSDFTFDDNVVLVHIKWSKTNQFRAKKLLVPLIKVACRDICPISWIRYMFKILPAPSNAPAFCLPHKSKGLLPLTYGQLDQQLKAWVTRIGLNGRAHSTHGLRRGGASWAFKVNISSLAIKTIRDWALNAYESYIQHDIETRLQAMIAFAKHL